MPTPQTTELLEKLRIKTADDKPIRWQLYETKYHGYAVRNPDDPTQCVRLNKRIYKEAIAFLFENQILFTEEINP